VHQHHLIDVATGLAVAAIARAIFPLHAREPRPLGNRRLVFVLPWKATE